MYTRHLSFSLTVTVTRVFTCRCSHRSRLSPVGSRLSNPLSDLRSSKCTNCRHDNTWQHRDAVYGVLSPCFTLQKNTLDERYKYLGSQSLDYRNAWKSNECRCCIPPTTNRVGCIANRCFGVFCPAGIKPVLPTI